MQSAVLCATTNEMLQLLIIVTALY